VKEVISMKGLCDHNSWMTPSQAARLLQVSAERVRQLVRAGRLRAVTTPLGRLLPRAAVEAEAERRRRRAAGK
jgi:excisionase family DNA binding protein